MLEPKLNPLREKSAVSKRIDKGINDTTNFIDSFSKARNERDSEAVTIIVKAKD